MTELPILAFATSAEFRDWLRQHHVHHQGIRLKLAKKNSGIASVSYAQALDEALCFGWIDSQNKAFDETTFLQKFTKRGARSIWSKINVAHVARLTEAGQMQAAGLLVVEQAKVQGRWDTAYSGSGAAQMPADFLAALEQQPKAKAFFDTLNKTKRYPIYFRLTSAKKPETRSKRIADFVAMLARGETLS